MSDDIKTVTDVTKTSADAEKTEAKKYDEEYVNTLKAESIARGKKLKEVEDRLKKFEDEKLTESEKDKKKIADLEAEKIQILSGIKEKDIDNLILKGISGKNIVDADTAMLLIKKELSSEENIDDKVVAKVIDKLLKDKPFLISSTNIIPGDGNFKKQDSELAKTSDQMFGEFLHGK